MEEAGMTAIGSMPAHKPKGQLFITWHCHYVFSFWLEAKFENITELLHYISSTSYTLLLISFKASL